MTENQLRMIVREECQTVIQQQLCNFGLATILPVMETLEQVLRSQKLLNDGQTYVEKAMLDRMPDDTDNDGEAWRESLR